MKNRAIKQIKYKMSNFDVYTTENKIERNPTWLYIPDHKYKVSIVDVSGRGKINALLNLIDNQPDIDKIYQYAKYQYEAKHQYLI